VQRRAAAVAAMKDIPGTEVYIGYQHEVDAKGQPLRKAKQPPPGWLARWLGNEFDATISSVKIKGRGGRLAMSYLPELGPIEHLSIMSADFEWSSDDLWELSRYSELRTLELYGVTLAHPGVVHLKRLERLETLQLGRARMYGTTVKNWQRKLPDSI
jgi:hypothetical protein